MAKLYAYTFGRVPDALLFDASVSDRAKVLYAVLTRYGDQWNRQLPEQEELAKVLGCSLASAKRAVAELKDKGALTVTQERDQSGQLDWSYRMPWEANPVSQVTPGHSSQVTDGVTSGNGASSQVGPQLTGDRSIRAEEKASPNGDGRDARADTMVGKAVDALGFRPVEIGAFGQILKNAVSSGVPEDVILRAVRHWGDGAEPMPWLTGHIGQLHREHMARTRRRSGNQEAQTRHDGSHDPTCWCYQVPEDQRAKVHRGDLLRAAGLPVAKESGAVPETTGEAVP